MKRNTAKEKKKRNKGFPYRSQVNGHLNDLDKYELVSETGKHIEFCRTLFHAQTRKRFYETNYWWTGLIIVKKGVSVTT